MKICISTAIPARKYEIVDTVFAIDAHKAGMFFSRAVDPEKAFEGVKDILIKKCKTLGGDAVISCQFDYHCTTSTGFSPFSIGFMDKKAVVEIFAYGTVIKFID